MQGSKERHVGLPTIAALPYTEEPEDLEGGDVAIDGAPYDNQFDHPGTRYGPRASRAASHVGTAHPEVGIDPLETMRVIDYGDAPIIQQDGDWSSKAIRRTVSEVVEAGAIPLTLGGDHRITNPCIRAVAERHGQLGLVHFDAHNDTDPAYLGLTENNHSTVFHSLVDEGLVEGRRYAQIGLRGYYTFEDGDRLAARAGDHDPLDARRPRPRHPRGDRRRRRAARRRTDLRHGRHRRPRPRLRAGHGHARSRRHDHARPLLGRARGAAAASTSSAPTWSRSRRCESEGADITAFAGHYVAREVLNGIALRRAGA